VLPFSTDVVYFGRKNEWKISCVYKPASGESNGAKGEPYDEYREQDLVIGM
jgi:hypothetical protein